MDADGTTETNHELIDRFAINITSPVGSTSGRRTYSGVFGLAVIDLTIGLKCTEDFTGPNCDEFKVTTQATTDLATTDREAGDGDAGDDNETSPERDIAIPVSVSVVCSILIVAAFIIVMVCVCYNRKHKASRSVVRHSCDPVATIHSGEYINVSTICIIINYTMPARVDFI